MSDLILDFFSSLWYHPYFWYTIEIIGFSFLILGSLNLRKNNENFKYEELFIISSLYHILNRLFPILGFSFLFFLDTNIISHSIISTVVHVILNLITMFIFFIYIGLKNKEFYGNWLVWSGLSWIVGLGLAIIWNIYFYINIDDISVVYSSSITTNMWILIRTIYISSLILFMIFGIKNHQNLIIFAAIFLITPHLQQIISLLSFN